MSVPLRGEVKTHVASTAALSPPGMPNSVRPLPPWFYLGFPSPTPHRRARWGGARAVDVVEQGPDRGPCRRRSSSWGGTRGPCPPLHQLADPDPGASGGFASCCIAWGTLIEVNEGGGGVDRDALGPPRGCRGGSWTAIRVMEVTWDPLRRLDRPQDRHPGPLRGLSGDSITHIGDRRRRSPCL